MSSKFLSCYSCEHCHRNDRSYSRAINGRFIKPFESYCGFKGGGKTMKRIGRRDRPSGRMYPAWCPLYKDAGSCYACGKTVYADENAMCTTCRRKGL